MRYRWSHVRCNVGWNEKRAMVSVRSSCSFLSVILILQHISTVFAFEVQRRTPHTTYLESTWRAAKEKRGELRNFRHDAALGSFGDYPWLSPGSRLKSRKTADLIGESSGQGAFYSKEVGNAQLAQEQLSFGNELDDGWVYILPFTFRTFQAAEILTSVLKSVGSLAS